MLCYRCEFCRNCDLVTFKGYSGTFDLEFCLDRCSVPDCQSFFLFKLIIFPSQPLKVTQWPLLWNLVWAAAHLLLIKAVWNLYGDLYWVILFLLFWNVSHTIFSKSVPACYSTTIIWKSYDNKVIWFKCEARRKFSWSHIYFMSGDIACFALLLGVCTCNTYVEHL